uniref:GlcNAc-PI de-N-acetylase n=1 Tax=Ganoderma boninense TaxID=34458 RepID=A0A5K1JWD9_9APHY|nr:GlcNAc-PI de-N-acetylase [Ganoderma boninense]
MSDTTTKRITLYAAVVSPLYLHLLPRTPSSDHKQDSPFPHRVRLALEEAKATYDVIWIDLVDKPEWYEKKVYPGEGRVPYLVYGGPALSADEAPSGDAVGLPDSLVILEFLADLFPAARLLPVDPVRRAQARLFAAHFVEKTLLPAWFPSVFMGAPTDGLFAVLDELQRRLDAEPEGGFLFGEWSVADAAVLPILLRMEHIWRLKPFTLREGEADRALETWNSPRFARLRQYVEDNKKRESVAKTWDEARLAADVERNFARRIDRFKRTGVINSDLRLPVPAGQE